MNSLTQTYGISNGGKPGIRNNQNGGSNQSQAPINDDDSGQGSSLDRDYAIYNNTTPDHHRYANPPSMYSMDHNVVNGNGSNGVSPGVRRQHHHHPHQQQQYSNGLDLTNNREYRGSAFELYKKPLTSHNGSSPGHYQNSVW